MDEGSGGQGNEEGQAVLAGAPEAHVEPPPEPQSNDGEKGASSSRASLAKRLQGFSPIFELFVTIAAVGTLVLLWVQLHHMKVTNQLTRESNNQTREANERTLRLMEESNRLTREALAESRRQAEESLAAGREQAEANLEVSRRSLADSRRTFEEAQRAHLVVDRCESREGNTSVRAVSCVGACNDSISVPSNATVQISNTGTFPAANVRWTIDYSMFESSEEIPEPDPLPRKTIRPRWSAYSPEVNRAVIGGGATAAILVKFRQPDLQYPRMFPVVHGRVDYIDGFDRDRVLRFCWYFDLNEAPPTWKPCDHHNWLD